VRGSVLQQQLQIISKINIILIALEAFRSRTNGGDKHRMIGMRPEVCQ
jgi:hypothetical protein